MARLRTTAFALALASFATVHAQEVGTVTTVRDVKITRAPVALGQPTDYIDARDGQRVRNNYGLRTLRRSRAEIHFFTDSSILRVNERTDMIIEDAKGLRTVQLKAGAVWVKVAKGVNTTVQTPTATATARGTEFEVRSNGDLLVYEGTVDFQLKLPDGSLGPVIHVSAGQKVTIGADGKPSEPTALTPAETPSNRGGGTPHWFDPIEDGGIAVLAGTNDFQELRSDPVNEDLKRIDTKGGSELVVIVRDPQSPVDPKRDLPLVDDTETSYLIPALALGATLAADWDHLQPLRAPAYHGFAFAFAGKPSFAGGRLDLEGAIGDSRYGYEANVVQFYRDPETGVLGRFGSMLYLERPLTDELKVFAGRRRFYHGPVFSDAIDTQLIADRYSSVGFRMDKKAVSVEAAWLYDANRYVPGAQRGGLGSVFLRAYGGVLGGHILETTGIPGAGHGRTVSLSMPVVRHLLEGYGEFGTGIDGTTNETLGAYLPGVFQKTGVDVFFEYARKRGVQQAYSVVGMYTVPKGPLLRGSLDWVDGDFRINAGLALRF